MGFSAFPSYTTSRSFTRGNRSNFEPYGKMKAVDGHDDGDATGSRQVRNEDSSIPQDRATRRRYYPKSETTDLDAIRQWYRRYKATDQEDLNFDRPIIKDLDSDQLDEPAIEKCIFDLAKEVTIKGRFCDECQYSFNHWPDSRISESTVLRNFHTLIVEAAAQRGCKFCSLILQDLRDRGSLSIIRKIESRLELIGVEATTSLQFTQIWGKWSSKMTTNWPGTTNKLGIKSKDLLFIDGREIKESADVDEELDVYDKELDALEIANFWMDSCYKDHKECAKSPLGPLPTRLISVAGDTLRLVLTADLDTKKEHPYSTLSHCWGTNDFLKLELKNCDSLLKKINLADLPKSFKDAIAITQGLKLDYLWIDSLCIIQDDEKDWEHEASLMSSVYGRSAINLAASSALNAYQGFFLKPKGFVNAIQVLVKSWNASYVQEFKLFDAYDRAVRGSHLATRAWAIQEKLLPTRTIHFGNRGAFWECKGLISDELLPFESAQGFVTGLPADYCMVKDTHRIARNDLFWWESVVRLFSAAKLTYGKDKLPALSGIAQLVQSMNADWRYLAGIWQNDKMEGQICWRACNPQTRPAEWRAPSWSWISVDGAIESPRVFYKVEIKYCHVLHAETRLASEDPFGPVLRGFGSMRIRCSGLLVGKIAGRKTITVENGDPKTNIYRNLIVYHRDYLDNHSEMKGNPGDLEEKLIDEGIVYLMPVFREEKYDNVTHGIVLERTGRELGQFNRIGYFGITPYDGSGHMTHDLFGQALEKRGKEIASSVTAEIKEYVKYPDMRMKPNVGQMELLGTED